MMAQQAPLPISDYAKRAQIMSTCLGCMNALLIDLGSAQSREQKIRAHVKPDSPFDKMLDLVASADPGKILPISGPNKNGKTIRDMFWVLGDLLKSLVQDEDDLSTDETSIVARPDHTGHMQYKVILSNPGGRNYFVILSMEDEPPLIVGISIDLTDDVKLSWIAQTQ